MYHLHYYLYLKLPTFDVFMSCTSCFRLVHTEIVFYQKIFNLHAVERKAKRNNVISNDTFYVWAKQMEFIKTITIIHILISVPICSFSPGPTIYIRRDLINVCTLQQRLPPSYMHMLNYNYVHAHYSPSYFLFFSSYYSALIFTITSTIILYCK